MHTRHAKEYSRAWQSIVAIRTAVSAPVPHTEAYTNVQHIIVPGWSDTSSPALGTAAYSNAKHMAGPLSAAAQAAASIKATYLA